MSIIEDLIQRVKSVNDGLTSGEWVRDIIVDNEAYIVDLNVEDQLYERGVNALGVSISDYKPYSPFTVEIKRMKGQPTNRVTLRDTGDFHSSFYVEAGNEQFEIKAADDKTASLIKKYGREIFGLTDENLKDIIENYIYPDLLDRTRKTIFG